MSHASYRVPSCETYVSYSLCPAYGAMITQRQSCPFAILSMSFIRIAHPIVYLSYNDYDNYNDSDLDLDLDCYKWGWLVDMMSARSVFHSKVWHPNFSGNRTAVLPSLAISPLTVVLLQAGMSRFRLRAIKWISDLVTQLTQLTITDKLRNLNHDIEG